MRKNNININEVFDDGSSYVSLAIGQRDANILRTILACGGDANQPLREDLNPLEDLLKNIYEKLMDGNFNEQEVDTQIELVRILLENGADSKRALAEGPGVLTVR